MSKIVLAAVLPALLAVACSRSRTVTTRDGSVTFEKDGKDSATIKVLGKDGQGTIEINSGKGIADYPSDAPLYKGAKSIYDMKSEEKHSRSLSMETTDPADKIAEFYKKELEGRGWTIDSSITSGPITMYTATKEKRQLMVQITSDEKKTVITQVLADKS